MDIHNWIMDVHNYVDAMSEARYASTHARVNNHRLLSLPLCGDILKKLIMVKSST